MTVKDCGISKYQRRVAFRVYHLYEHVGVKQILQLKKVTIQKILDLKQPEYEQLVEDTRFAGAQD